MWLQRFRQCWKLRRRFVALVVVHAVVCVVLPPWLFVVVLLLLLVHLSLWWQGRLLGRVAGQLVELLVFQWQFVEHY
jgi:hypothetical protein